MKKKIFIFLLGSLLFFSFPKNAQACYDLGGGANCQRGELRCNGNTGATFCCTQAETCSAAPGGAAQATTQPDAFGSSTSPDIHGSCGDTGINTAIGCINFGSQTSLFGDLLRWAVGIGGGISFLLIVYAGFLIMTSAGNPDRLKAGQELLTSALSGLILLIFSIFVLRFIGIDILGLNAFGFGSAQ